MNSHGFRYNKAKDIFPKFCGTDHISSAKPTVIIFYHAGGNANQYRSLCSSDDIIFLPYELPGRGLRRNEQFAKGLFPLAESICIDLLELFDGRVCFLYGHSLGALIAFSVAYLLEKKYNKFPNRLIVAARHSPDVVRNEGYRCSQGQDALLDELKRLEYMPEELLVSREFMELAMPIIYSDFALHENYSYNGEVINTPISVWYGQNDDISIDELKPWAALTTRETTMRCFDGGHFFVFDNADLVHNVFCEEILHAVTHKK